MAFGGLFSTSKGKSSSTTNTQGTYSKEGLVEDTGSTRMTGGSSSTGLTSQLGQTSQLGSQKNQWGALPALLKRLEPFLKTADQQFLGGTGTRYASPIGEAQGAINENGAQGVQNNLQKMIGDRAATVLGANNRDDSLKSLYADDIQRRLNRQFSMAGRYGSPVHQGVTTRELGRFNREYEQDQFNREVTGLNSGSQAAQDLQALQLNPLMQYGQLLGGLAGLGGEQTGATEQTEASEQKGTHQTDTTQFQDTLTQMIRKIMESGEHEETATSKGRTKSEGFSLGF